YMIQPFAEDLANRGGLPVEVGIVSLPHLAAAAPRHVADPEERNPKRLVAAVRASFLREGRARRRGHVLEPLDHFARRAGAEVARDVGLRADGLDEREELVRAECIRLLDAAPAHVDRDGP